jgi:hypothetical protein
MVSRILLSFSLLALPLCAFADTATDYIDRGAQKYIFGDDEGSKAEIAAGLAKFPEDPKLRKMAELFKNKKKPPPPSKKDQNQQNKDEQNQQNQNQQNQQQQQNKDQQKNGGGNKQGQQNRAPSPSPSPGQSPSASPSPSPGESPSPSPSASPGESPSPSSTPGETATPTPGEGDHQGENESGETPTPAQSGNEKSQSPTPGEGEQSAGPSPTATPMNSPEKKFAGDVKAASGDEKKDEKSQQAIPVEPVKEGEMTPEQAERLLQSMKDEEQRVQLDERRAVRPVYKDW